MDPYSSQVNFNVITKFEKDNSSRKSVDEMTRGETAVGRKIGAFLLPSPRATKEHLIYE
jgi:hypothetical protein